MQKTILITGSTDGIGLETASMLLAQGHRVLLHGRNETKLARVHRELAEQANDVSVESYLADFSKLADVSVLANAITEKHSRLDVLINNAGVLNSADPITRDGLDARFAVNTVAPYLLTQLLLPLLGENGRVINLSSAAQSPVNTRALTGHVQLSDDFEAYAQSKLALTMWSRHLSEMDNGPATIAVNPGSLLGSKMVRDGFGVAGGDLKKGADILCRAALDESFAAASGQYFDNDKEQFASPHPDALDPQKVSDVVRTIENILEKL